MNLRLNVQNTSTTEQGLMFIAQCLKQKKDFQQLALGFGGTQQKNNKGILALAEAVHVMKNLKNLHVSMENTEIEHGGMTKLFQNLTGLRYLQVLKLNFGKCEMTDDSAIEALAVSVAQIMPRSSGIQKLFGNSPRTPR